MSDFDERARKAADGVHRALEQDDVDLNRGAQRAKRKPVTRAAIPGAVAVVALIAGMFTLIPDDGVKIDNGKGTFALAGELKAFDECDDALLYFKTHAPDYLIERADDGYASFDEGARSSGAPVTTGVPPEAMADSTQSEASKQTPDASSKPGAQASTTNVAEKGVDEPDIVKTDGTTVVAVTSGVVRLLAANNGNPLLRKTLPEQNVSNVLLNGTRLVVFSGSLDYHGNFGPMESRRPLPQSSAITLYDITDISAPKQVSSLEITGGVIDARLVGNMVRVVAAFTPDVDTASPQYGPDDRITDASKQNLRDAVNKTTIDSWLPTFKLHDEKGTVISRGRLVECNTLGHPTDFSGLDTVTLTTFDMSKSLDERKAAGVVAGGQQIYATAENLYVTSSKWSVDARASDTNIHEFTTDNTGASNYRGSGTVPGTLLNQYSMSEHNGVLRIATTVNGERGWVRRQSIVEGIVTTLQLKDGKLQQIGFVGGLGKEDNESIQSVRFVGDKGYVTTFRQTDPLYVIDLKDATQPRVAGQLKIEGFSGYLHPINDTLLLGVGQSGGGSGASVLPIEPDAPTETTAPKEMSIAPVQQPGVEFSLFDVSDPSSPRKVGSKVYGAGVAGAQFDPKAFLYWAPRDLIIAPVNEYGTWDSRKMETVEGWSGLVLLRATNSGLTEVGRLRNFDAQNNQVNRSFVIDNNVYQLSDMALQVNSLDTHKDIARLKFQ